MFINRHKKGIRLLFRVLFYVYLFVLIYFLFFAEMLGRTNISDTYHYNLIPFFEIRRFLIYRNLLGLGVVFMNLAGNILIFTPFGFLVPIMYRGSRRWWKILLFSLLLSAVVEVVQMLTHTGSLDVDDLLLNTVGGILGYLVYRGLQSRRIRHLQRQKQEKGVTGAE